jgi:hypothetical protein
MSSSNDEQRDLASCLNKDVLRAILEAGSYEPDEKESERPCAYEIDFGDESCFASIPAFSSLGVIMLMAWISRARAATPPPPPSSAPDKEKKG